MSLPEGCERSALATRSGQGFLGGGGGHGIPVLAMGAFGGGGTPCAKLGAEWLLDSLRALSSTPFTFILSQYAPWEAFARWQPG